MALRMYTRDRVPVRLGGVYLFALVHENTLHSTLNQTIFEKYFQHQQSDTAAERDDGVDSDFCREEQTSLHPPDIGWLFSSTPPGKPLVRATFNELLLVGSPLYRCKDFSALVVPMEPDLDAILGRDWMQRHAASLSGRTLLCGGVQRTLKTPAPFDEAAACRGCRSAEGVHVDRLSPCFGCPHAYYCSDACLARTWRTHRHECARRAWTPETHALFPADFRAAVKCLLLLAQHDPHSGDPRYPGACVWQLPRELLFLVVELLAEAWYLR